MAGLREKAEAWVETFESEGLRDTLYAKQLLPIMRWVVAAQQKLSLGARLRILWTGYIPKELGNDQDN